MRDDNLITGCGGFLSEKRSRRGTRVRCIAEGGGGSEGGAAAQVQAGEPEGDAV